MMRLNKFLFTAALLSTSAALAQGPGPGGPGGPGRGGPRGGAFGMQRSWKVVIGAPYSADVSDVSVRTLPDSNTIQRTTTGHVARDSEGRTYSTETISGGMMGQAGPKTITFISDPVAGYSYVLDATTKTATKRAIHEPAPKVDNPLALKNSARPANPNVATTDLGTQAIAGVTAQGKQTTRTVPAGQIGNALPLVSTSESWYSPDLQVVVFSKRSDPQGGLSTYALSSVVRTEPAASLFQVPADYTVKDVPKGGRGAGGGGGFRQPR